MKQDTLLMFDLDGTLWDSAQEVAESWNEVLLRADPSLPELTADDIHGVMGMTMKEISQVMHPAMNPEMREQVFGECCRYEVDYLYSHPGRLYPALRETLDLQPIEPFRRWLEKWGFWENGRLGPNAGDASVFL